MDGKVKALSLLLLLAAPLAVHGQGLSLTAPGGNSTKEVKRLSFSTPGCFASGTDGVVSTRASVGTYVTAANAIGTCQIDEYRVESRGLLREPASQNELLRSGALSTSTSPTSPWAQFGAGTTIATVAGDPAGGNWAEVAGTLASCGIYQAVTGLTSTTTMSGSAWMAKASGTGSATVQVATAGSTVSSCTCSRSDGGVCTASAAGTNGCNAVVNDLGTTPVRVCVVFTATAVTASTLYLMPGDRTAANAASTTRFSLAQLERGDSCTSYIPTTTAAASRAADSVPSVKVSGLGKINSVKGSFATNYGSAWSRTADVWTLGVGREAGSATLGLTTAPATSLAVYDMSRALTTTATSHSFAAGSQQTLKSSLGKGWARESATMWLGGTSGYPATTETQFNGYVKDLVITRSGPALAPQSIVYVFGDSVTWGYSTSGVTMSYPTKLGQLLGPAYSVWNHGIPGALVPAVATEQTKTLTLEAAPAYVVILAGVNSVRNSVPTATVQSQLQAMYEEVVAAGAVPIPVTITPWAGFAGWSAGLQTNTETVNAWILAYCASNSLTCVDAYTDLLGVAGALDAEYDSGDHLHPNQAGTDRIAALVRAAIP